jgi:hypothetical protein
MVATRVEIDHTHVCLACGAPWRVVSSSSDIVAAAASSSPGIIAWNVIREGCADECWRSDYARYEAGTLRRRVLGWKPWVAAS